MVHGGLEIHIRVKSFPQNIRHISTGRTLIIILGAFDTANTIKFIIQLHHDLRTLTPYVFYPEFLPRIRDGEPRAGRAEIVLVKVEEEVYDELYDVVEKDIIVEGIIVEGVAEDVAEEVTVVAEVVGEVVGEVVAVVAVADDVAEEVAEEEAVAEEVAAVVVAVA